MAPLSIRKGLPSRMKCCFSICNTRLFMGKPRKAIHKIMQSEIPRTISNGFKRICIVFIIVLKRRKKNVEVKFKDHQDSVKIVSWRRQQTGEFQLQHLATKISCKKISFHFTCLYLQTQIIIKNNNGKGLLSRTGHV